MVETTKIYLNTWKAYNEGYIGYGWMDASEAREFIEADPERDGGEWFIADIDNYFGFELADSYDYCNVMEIIETIETLENMHEWELEEITAIMEAHGGSVKEAIEAQEAGKYIYYSGRTIEELAEELADEQIACYTHDNKIPDFFTRYFDYEAYARDLEDDFIETSKGCITRY